MAVTRDYDAVTCTIILCMFITPAISSPGTLRSDSALVTTIVVGSPHKDGYYSGENSQNNSLDDHNFFIVCIGLK